MRPGPRDRNSKARSPSWPNASNWSSADASKDSPMKRAGTGVPWREESMITLEVSATWGDGSGRSIGLCDVSGRAGAVPDDTVGGPEVPHAHRQANARTATAARSGLTRGSSRRIGPDDDM